MFSLTFPQITLMVIAACTFIALLSNRFTPDVVALLTLLALSFTQLVTIDQALAGFSRQAVMTIIGLFIITSTLEDTGVVSRMAQMLGHISGESERRMIVIFMGTGALFSLMMNNIAAGAVLLPVAVNVAEQANIRPSKILMPLGFGTLVGGMATLFTTANIIMSNTFQSQGLPTLDFSDFLPLGIMTVAASIIYMVTIGARLLPDRGSLRDSAFSHTNLLETYQLGNQLWEVRVLPNSPLVGCTLERSELASLYKVTIVAIWRGNDAKLGLHATDIIKSDDILLVSGRPERVQALKELHTAIGRKTRYQTLLRDLAVQLCEVVIVPRAPIIGATLHSIRFRTRYNLTVIGVWREGRSHLSNMGNLVMQSGDALLVVGSPKAIASLAEEPGYAVLSPIAKPSHLTPKAPWAIGVTVLVLVLSALNVAPTAEIVLGGTGLLLLSRTITPDLAYRAIEWKVVVLIAGMSPLSTALVQTGLTDRISEFFTSIAGSFSPLSIIVMLYLLAAALAQLIGGQVTALVIGPLAANIAIAFQLNPIALGVAVSMACSAAFLTPIGHPVNVLMMSAGNYRAKDFLRVGVGLFVVCLLTLIIGLPLIWDLRAS